MYRYFHGNAFLNFRIQYAKVDIGSWHSIFILSCISKCFAFIIITYNSCITGGSTNQRWAFSRHNNDDDFVSRYDRMTDAGNDYSVFNSNLPGNIILIEKIKMHILSGLSWLWLYGSLIYNYLCNQRISPLNLWVRIPLMARCTSSHIYQMPHLIVPIRIVQFIVFIFQRQDSFFQTYYLITGNS